MTRKEIEDRLKALADYERSLLAGIGGGYWDEGALTDREMMRVAIVKSKLLAMLKGGFQ